MYKLYIFYSTICIIKVYYYLNNLSLFIVHYHSKYTFRIFKNNSVSPTSRLKYSSVTIKTDLKKKKMHNDYFDKFIISYEAVKTRSNKKKNIFFDYTTYVSCPK